MPRRRRPGKVSSSWIRKEKRWAIYRRDNYACVWCGKAELHLTLDHIFPRGHRCRDNDARRLVTACVSCNTSRKDRSVSEWMRGLADRDGALRRLLRARSSVLDKAAAVAEMFEPLRPLEDDHYVSGGVPF